MRVGASPAPLAAAGGCYRPLTFGGSVAAMLTVEAAPVAMLLLVLPLAACAHGAAGAATAADPGSGQLVLLAGGGAGGDGARATEARLEQPFAVAIDPRTGDQYVAEFKGNRVRRIDGHGVITTVVGPGAPGEAGKFTLKEPHHLLFPPGGGDLYIADTFNNRIVRFTPATGAVAPFAPEVTFGKTFCLAFDPRGQRLYVAETRDNVIRYVDLATMAVSSVQGEFRDPRAVAVDSRGQLYVLSRNGHSLSVVDGNGRTTLVAGTGKKGYSGDGGDPRQAALNGPKHLTIDAHDDVLIADTENHVIRKVLVRQNKIVRVAGTGTEGSGAVPGPPAAVALARPHGVLVAPDGALIISDSWNGRLLRLPQAGSTQPVSTPVSTDDMNTRQ
jgi:DNA-binding beta-propeller fold protein YncE